MNPFRIPRRAATAVVLSALAATVLFSQNRSRFSGYWSAIDYAYGVTPSGPAALQVDIGNTIPGTWTITLASGTTTLSDGTILAPLNVNAPIRIGSGPTLETVTPVSVNCSTPSLTDTCSFVATFAYAHGVGDRVTSGTVGLQEALNAANSAGGGVAIVDGRWFAAGGTSAMVSAATTTSVTSIINNSTGGGIAGVASFNTRTGPIVLQNGDVFTVVTVAPAGACSSTNIFQILNSTGTYSLYGCVSGAWGVIASGGTAYSFQGALQQNGVNVTCLTATSAQGGCLAAADWSTFNAKQAALGYTPLNPALNLSDVASAATTRTNLGLGSIATAASSAYLGDSGANGLVKRTSAGATAAASQGVDFYQPGGTKIANTDLQTTITSSTSGNAATATALAATPTACSGGQFATSIAANGNANCGSVATGGPTVTSGTALPAAANCSTAGNVTSIYYQQGNNGSSTPTTPQRMYVCGTNGASPPTYRWIPVVDNKISVLAFKANVDSATDDQPAFQNAVNAAQLANYYSGWDSGPVYLGANVYVPCGDYAVGSPIILPRSGTSASRSYSGVNATVGIVGENHNCAALHALSGSGFNGVGGIYITNPGSGYVTASPPAITVGAGCTVSPTATAIVAPASVSLGFVMGAYITNLVGAGAANCTNLSTMPTCTIAPPASGTTAQCEFVGRAMIEWAPLSATIENGGSYQRTWAPRIEQLRFQPPNQDGVMPIHFQPTNYPINDSNCAIGFNIVCERMEQAQFRYLDFLGSNQYTPAEILISGDCNSCDFEWLAGNPALAGGSQKYQTPLVATNYAADAIQNECEGLQYGTLANLACGGDKNGSSPCFEGRLQRAEMHTAFCDGANNPFGIPACYAFLNSAVVTATNLGNEGNGGTQILLENSRHFIVQNYGIGSPINWAITVTGNTHSSTTIDGLGPCAGCAAGQYITGSGIPANATIASYTPGATSLTLSAAATSTVSGNSLSIYTDPAVAGVALYGSSDNEFTGNFVGNSNSWNSGSGPTGLSGAYRFYADSGSNLNEFKKTELANTGEVSIANLASNYMQYCTFGNCQSNKNWLSLGAFPYQESPVASAIASAATIAPQIGAVTHITGTTTIATISSACSGTGVSCQVTLIPDGAFATNTTGNIAIASTAVVGKALIYTYDSGTSTWYPSY